MPEHRLHNTLTPAVDRFAFRRGDLFTHMIYLSSIVIDRLHFLCSRETIISVDVATVRTLGRVDIFLALRGDQDIPLLVVYPSGQVVFLVSVRGDVGVHLMLVNTVEAVFSPVAGIGSDLLGEPAHRALNLLQHGTQL